MKILWLSHLVPYPPKGGVLQRAYHLVRETARYHDVHLHAFVQKDLFDIHFDDRRQAEEECRAGLSFCKDISFTDIPCDTRPFGKQLLAARSALTRLPYTINWLQSRAFDRLLREIAAGQEFDVVHCDTISLVPYADIFDGTPKTLDHHNIESQMMLRRAELETNTLKKRYFALEGSKLQAYEKQVCPQFDSNLTCSALDSERLQAFCPDATCTVIPNGVDTTYFSPDPAASQQTTMIFAGRLAAYTNAQSARFLASDIWPRITKLLPDATLDLVGHGAPEEAVALGAVEPRFRVQGFVDDVRDYLNTAMVYVCPMFDGGGTKLKILDAMAMGKAIVATRVACEGIDLDDGTSVLFAETGDEFAAAIARLAGDPELRARLGANARNIALDTYSYESIGRALANEFERVAALA